MRGLRGLLPTAKPIRPKYPPKYPFGTVLRHRDTFVGGGFTRMDTMKAMVIGRADAPGRITVIRLTGLPDSVGEVCDVLVDSWVAHIEDQ